MLLLVEKSLFDTHECCQKGEVAEQWLGYS